MPEEFQKTWSRLSAELEDSSRELSAECEGALKDVADLVTSVEQRYLSATAPECGAGTTESLRSLFEGDCQALLNETLTGYRRTQPQRRALRAFQQYLRDLDDVAAETPRIVRSSGRELVEALGDRAPSGWRGALLRRSKKARRLPMRAVVAAVHRSRREILLKRAGMVVLRLAQLEDSFTDPWDGIVEEGLRQLDGSGADQKEFEHDRKHWTRLVARRRAEAAKALAALKQELDVVPSILAYELTRRGSKLASSRSDTLDQTASCISYWEQQCRAVQSRHDLTASFSSVGRKLSQTTEHSLQAVDTERTELIKELDHFIEVLGQWDGTIDAHFVPAASINLISAEHRIRDWAVGARQLAQSGLPSATELVEPRKPLPPRRSPWRTTRLRDLFIRAVDRVAKPSDLRGVVEVEEAHRRIVSDIDHARQVVLYGFEVAARDKQQEMAAEAVSNALQIAQRRRGRIAESRTLAEPSLASAAAAALSSTHGAAREGHVGLLKRLARQRSRRVFRNLLTGAAAGLRRIARIAWKGLRDGYRQVLIYIGWEPAPASKLAPLERRARLVSTSKDATPANFPLIYARLFRPESVEDPRFLVGRETEMAAIQEGRAAWEAGNPTAILVVGERGSGKTSILNCARVRVLEGTPLHVGAFAGRLSTAADMDSYLHSFFQIDEKENLIVALNQRRCVVVIEEMERTFLRRIGGFEALKRLLTIVTRTNESVLWLLSVNYAAAKLTDAAVGLSRSFSHRINARAVSYETLSQAVLQRHHLSGLNLEFERTPQNATWERIQSTLGIERSAQEKYFEVLYAQSNGLFRSAFRLWNASIVSADSGSLRLRPPKPPETQDLRDALNLDDLFALQAVFQHGFLSAEEHALVFDVSPAVSNDRLKRLQDIGLIVPQEGDPGMRIRPRFAHVARRVLDANNLY